MINLEVQALPPIRDAVSFNLLPRNMHPIRIQSGRLMGILFILLPLPVFAGAGVEQPAWETFFDQHKARGTVVISDERSASTVDMVFNHDRAAKRFSPASTFKIPHAVFALDAGVVDDEFERIEWDGTERTYPAWNRDQNLRSSMRHSVVWVYQRFAKEIGEEKEREYLEMIQYGNREPTGENPFWVEGNLEISAYEQVAFLKSLYRNRLPFSVANQRLVKDVMLIEAGRDWILRGKTGWNGDVGWWVGWVEHPTGAVFFALNIDTPNRMDDLPKREGITRAILASLDALTPVAEKDGAEKPATALESKPEGSQKSEPEPEVRSR